MPDSEVGALCTLFHLILGQPSLPLEYPFILVLRKLNLIPKVSKNRWTRDSESTLCWRINTLKTEPRLLTLTCVSCIIKEITPSLSPSILFISKMSHLKLLNVSLAQVFALLCCYQDGSDDGEVIVGYTWGSRTSHVETHVMNSHYTRKLTMVS